MLVGHYLHMTFGISSFLKNVYSTYYITNTIITIKPTYEVAGKNNMISHDKNLTVYCNERQVKNLR